MAGDIDPTLSIPEQAAQWWTLLHSEGASSADHHEFGDWIARSPERVEAYLELTRLVQALKSSEVRWPTTPAEVLIAEARAAPPDPIQMPSVAEAAKVDTKQRPEGKFAMLRFAMVCAALLAIVIGAVWFVMVPPSQYSTRFGEQRSILLEDGSRVTLNTASRIEVQLEKNRRTVRLLKGEALFDVAHDPARPFEVHAGQTVLRAVGTQFNVDIREKKTTVTVLEGRVAVMDSASESAAGAGEAIVEPVILSPAERVVITPSGLSTPQHVENLAAATAWTHRQLVFEHEALGEVTEEFNRYSRQRIVIASPELARQEVTGVIQSDDPASFLSFLSGVSGVEIRPGEDGSHIVTLRSGALPGREE